MRRGGLAIAALIVVAAASSLVTWSITRAHGPSIFRSGVAECRQAQLQGAMEQRGGGGYAYIPLGYTFLLVNVSTTSCELRGYPYEILFSTTGGANVKVAISHHRTFLYAQPRARRVVLRPNGVASFGISYANDNVAPPRGPARCIATLVDFRLPALLSGLYSFEFVLRPIDFCRTARRVNVTPIEVGATPRA